jgi:hypothetical protein
MVLPVAIEMEAATAKEAMAEMTRTPARTAIIHGFLRLMRYFSLATND